MLPQRARLAEAALPFMSDLYAATHEVVALAVLDGTDTVWLEQLSGRLAPPVPSRVGGRLPAHVTAAGKALLAFAPEVVDALCARGLERHGPGTITDPEALRVALAEIRERGVAINREESSPACWASPPPSPTATAESSPRSRWPSPAAHARRQRRWPRRSAPRRSRSGGRWRT